MEVVQFDPVPGAGGLYYTVPPGIGGEKAPKMIVSAKKAGNMGQSDDTGNENRRTLFTRLGIPRESVRGLRQEHTKTVYTAESLTADDSSGGVTTGDGLISNDSSLSLTITIADCLPVFIFHKRGPPFGLLHSGWKGTGIAGTAVLKMVSEFGADPAELCAVIGPGIGSCCYRVDEERAVFFQTAFGKETVVRRGGGNGGAFLDLRRANLNILRKAGVQKAAVCSACSSCTPEFGSYRREGPENCTRMIALISYLL